LGLIINVSWHLKVRWEEEDDDEEFTMNLNTMENH
jgi:hypothetical protein